MSVAAIIPAYNEEKTIKDVIDVVKKVDKIDRIIVVSDGSDDRTVKIAKKCGVQVIALSKNIGKGGAMSRGVKKSKEDIILFLDADLIGLTTKHVEDLINPIIENKTSMTLGIFANGKITLDIAQRVAPFLTGQRALKRELFNQIENIEITRFGVEIALTRYIKTNDIPFLKVKLNNLSHLIKERKMGFFKGFIHRLKMYWEIIKDFKTVR
ncbi:MAG: glycosyltransferase family 2 protein [Bacilli bacterium]|nr:glycosyltransferase family 2 protein [Bacilli bacterium]